MGRSAGRHDAVVHHPGPAALACNTSAATALSRPEGPRLFQAGAFVILLGAQLGVKIERLHEMEAVTVGWLRGKGGRCDSLEALLLAQPDDDGWHFVGWVGTRRRHRTRNIMTSVAEIICLSPYYQGGSS